MAELTIQQLDQARRDPVVFADLVLGKPLWEHQVPVALATARYRLLCAGRRAGKTHVFGVLALHRMFSVPGSRVLMVSAGRSSVVRTHREIAGMARGPVAGTSIEDDQVMTLRLSNGSTLESVTQSTNAVRSADVDLLIVDEAGFVEQAVWESAEPTIGARPGARVLVASTPWRGPGHFFHDLWRQGMEDPGAEAQSWHWPSTVSPWVAANAEWLEGVRARSAPDYFEREYLAMWTGSSGSFFDSEEIDGATTDEDLVDVEAEGAAGRLGRVVGGVDWGMQRDAHALVVIAALPETDGQGRTRYAVRFIEERYKLSYEAWIERLADLAGVFTFALVSAETNGVGQMPAAVLERRLWEVTGGQVVEPVTTTARLKEDLFGFARLLLQQGRLVLPKHASLLKQLRSLEFETTDSGVMRIAVPDRIGHDDVAMAFALALRPLMAGELVPPVPDRIVGMDEVLGGDLEDEFAYLNGYGGGGW